ncbi:hypothetical protein IAD21_02331 [Abditibacteriota bacterium]|nr:hypothetical protein IAD21_02331 [Abditibacteriota bacterium]
MHERGELLRIKLAANQQRLFRQQYLSEFPESLGTYLEGCPYTQSPEFDQIVPMFYVAPQGVGRNAPDGESRDYFMPDGYIYREFSWANQLLEAVLCVSDQHDYKEAFLYPFDGPLYRVPFGWARENIMALFSYNARTEYEGRNYCSERVGIVTTDFKVGLVIDNYAGYLKEDLNPDEIVYQLAVWG